VDLEWRWSGYPGMVGWYGREGMIGRGGRLPFGGWSEGL
jgi:hypothetical protein